MSKDKATAAKDGAAFGLGEVLDLGHRTAHSLRRSRPVSWVDCTRLQHGSVAGALFSSCYGSSEL